MTELIAQVVTRYRCPHCRRSYAHRATAQKHLDRCFYNPAVRSCLTCHHLTDGAYYEERACAIDAADILHPSCSICGELAADHCHEHPNAKPVTGLRVRCDKWQRLSATPPETSANPA